MHRSRLCFARAFREPFVTGEGEMAKAVILALAIGLPLAALLFEKKIIDPYVAIPATFWIGSSASAVFKKLNLTAIDETNLDMFERTTVGFQAYLPELLSGWGITLLVSASLLLLWYALVRYNESTEKFTLM